MTDVTSPLSTDDVAAIHEARAIGLEIRLAIGGRSIAFDRKGVVVGPFEVVIEWASREPQNGAGGTTDVIGIEGDLLGRPGELTVQMGDLFMIEGQTAEVTIPAKDVDGVATAGFRLVIGGP